jgi:hypothetical protein
MHAQQNFSKVLRSIGPNESLALTRFDNKAPELQHSTKYAPPVFPDFVTRAETTWGTGWAVSPSQNLLDEARGER